MNQIRNSLKKTYCFNSIVNYKKIHPKLRKNGRESFLTSEPLKNQENRTVYQLLDTIITIILPADLNNIYIFPYTIFNALYIDLNILVKQTKNKNKKNVFRQMKNIFNTNLISTVSNRNNLSSNNMSYTIQMSDRDNFRS